MSKRPLAEVVVPCDDLAAALPFYLERLDFRLDSIFPADAPSTAVVSGYGVRLRLTPEPRLEPGLLRLTVDDERAGSDAIAPNGTRILFVARDERPRLPPLAPALVVSEPAADGWTAGRAGMAYRDLIPGRLGGRYIASHIRIVDGGPVPDYVHYHVVRFQMIYCYRGWVRVVYEDQGPDFVMRPGDCVLQPSGIRHRVLESAPGTEVIEIGSPALHMTHVDHAMTLPTTTHRPERDFDGQRFVRHEADAAAWRPWSEPGFEYRDSDIAAATDGLAGARVIRRAGEGTPRQRSHDAEFLFYFVLRGALTFEHENAGNRRLDTQDALVIPSGAPYSLAAASENLELLEVSLPAVRESA